MIKKQDKKPALHREPLLRETYIELVQPPTSDARKPQPKHSSRALPHPHHRITMSGLTEEGQRDNQMRALHQENPWDLTYVFINAGFNYRATMIIFLLLTAVRYMIMADLLYVYIFYDPEDWTYVFVILAARLIYIIIVLKVSLKDPESPTQILLRSHWSSKTNNSLLVMFEQIDARKLFISIFRGICPPELSFIYLSGHNKLKIYQAINYIYVSIESVFFYPCLIVELLALQAEEGKMGEQGTVLFALAVLAEAVTLSLTCYLYYLSCSHSLLPKRLSQ